MVDVTRGAVGGLMADDGQDAILARLRRGWWFPALGALAGLVLGVAAVRLVPPEHTARMVVGPTARAGMAAMGARAPAAGPEIAVGAAEPGPSEEALSDFSRYLHLLSGMPMADSLLADPVVVRRLYPTRWDSASGRWREPDGLLPAMKRAFLAVVGRTDWIEPDATVVKARLGAMIVIEPVGTGPMRRVWLRHPDRDFAFALLTRLARETDRHLRAEALRRGTASVAHINARMAATTNRDHQRVLSDLLRDQERALMMIGVDLPFAADVVEEPAVGALPDWPDPFIVVPLAGLAGLALGAFLLGAGVGWPLRKDLSL